AAHLPRRSPAMMLRAWVRTWQLLSQSRHSRRKARPSCAGRTVGHRVFLERLEDRTLLNGAALGTEQLRQAYGNLPLSFEANQGQTDAAVGVPCRGQGYTPFPARQEGGVRPSRRRWPLRRGAAAAEG